MRDETAITDLGYGGDGKRGHGRELVFAGV